MPKPSDNKWQSTDNSDKSKTSDTSFFLLFGLVCSFMGAFFLMASQSSNDSTGKFIGAAMLTVGIVVSIITGCVYFGSKSRGSQNTPSRSAADYGNLIPGAIFSLIGAAVLVIGVLTARWAVAIIGTLFLLFGLYMLYDYINCIRPYGNKVTFKINDGTTMTVDRSMVTDEEYKDIIDSDGPSSQTVNAIMSRTTNVPSLILIFCFITGAVGIVFIIAQAWIIAVPLLIMCVFLIGYYITIKRTDSDPVIISRPHGNYGIVDRSEMSKEELNDVFGPEEAKGYQKHNDVSYNNKKPSPDGVYVYVNCPYCGAINLKSDKVCHSCRRRL